MPPQNINSILIIKLSALGDVIMTLPAFEALRRTYPNARIDWLVEEPAAGIIEGLPGLNRRLISPRHQLKKHFKSGNYLDALKSIKNFLKELRAVNYDVVIDLQGLFKSGILTGLAKGRRKVGFDRTREKAYWFLNGKIPPYDPELHAARRYLQAAAYLGAAVEDEPDKYFPPAEPAALEKAAAHLAPINNRPYVILNPGAKWVTKKWPLKHWQTLAALLQKDGRWQVVITGGRDDEADGQAIAEAAPEALNLCGRTDLKTLAAIMAQAKLVVTGDTGPMHLAAAVGVKGLAMFGPTKPNRTGPFSHQFKVLSSDVDCLGCLKRTCDNWICLDRLPPQTVFDEICGQLS